MLDRQQSVVTPIWDQFTVTAASAEHAAAIATLSGKMRQSSARCMENTTELDEQLKTRGKLLVLAALLDNKLIAFERARFWQPQDFATHSEPPPEGWYLENILVDPGYQRQGVAMALTQEMLLQLSRLTEECYFFAHSNDDIAISIHNKFYFDLIDNDFQFPGLQYNNNQKGLLYRKLLY